MKKFLIQIFALSLFIVFIFLLTFNQTVSTMFISLFGQSNASYSQKIVQIIDPGTNIAKVEVKSEIADTKDKRAKGLGGRDSLAKDSGMLFIFDNPSKQTFWMKTMKFSLDFIWIKGDEVVDLLPDVPPPDMNVNETLLPRYGSSVEVDKVLEVNQGFIKEKNIKVGDKILIKEISP